jgi:hypothetical protein
LAMQFYSHILSLFLKRMAECDYSTGNEDALALLKVAALAIVESVHGVDCGVLWLHDSV